MAIQLHYKAETDENDTRSSMNLAQILCQNYDMM